MKSASVTRRTFLAGTSAAFAAAPWLRALPPGGSPAAQFLNPPAEARPSTYWVWLNGHTDAAQMTRELEALEKNGFGAAYILEIGAREKEVPAGPAWFSPESVKAIGHAAREAKRLGLEIGFTNASSWNSGGPWITPEYASKGLYVSRFEVEGPRRFTGPLPFPALPGGVPAKPDGSPEFYSEVAVLAVPEKERLESFDFLFDLDPGAPHVVDRAVLHNESAEYAAKDFLVLASETGMETHDFREVLRGTLRRETGAQSFRFPAVKAKYLKLRIVSGYHQRRIALAEFEAFSTDGRDVASMLLQDGAKTQGGLLRFTSQAGIDREWMAANIYDGRLKGGAGSWAADQPRPLLVRDASSIVDLTANLKNGSLGWDVPPGKWTILRFLSANTGERLKLPSPNSDGLILDHFDERASRMHTTYMLDRLREQLGDISKTALKYFYACSYEVRGSIWTPRMLEEFRLRRGYDMLAYLPVLSGTVVENEEVSERFRIDYKRTVSDLMIDGFYRTTKEVANRAGLKLVAEAGGPGWPLHQVPVDSLKASGSLDIMRGEFWMRDRDIWVVKETASAAHIYGKRVVQMESFTSFRQWQDPPSEIKRVANRALTEGCNHFVWHTMGHVPPGAGKPGFVYHAGTHLGPNDTWWPMGRGLSDYLARTSWLLRQGLPVGDVCCYYGENGFNFVPARHVVPSLGFGYDYDVVNSDVILTRMTARNGRIVLPDGVSYEVLVLPDRPDMDLEVLQKLAELVHAGATICGPKPQRATSLKDYPVCDERVRSLADRIWGECDGSRVRETSYGKGKVYWGMPLKEILLRRGVGPDFSFTSRDKQTDLDFIHRSDGERDIYFVRNTRGEWAEADCEFRVSGKAPVLCDPVSGEELKVAAYESRGKRTSVLLSLPPHGGMIVVFEHKSAAVPLRVLRNGERVPANVLHRAAGRARLLCFEPGEYVVEEAKGKRSTTQLAPLPAPASLDGEWTVGFAPGLGAPASKVYPRLASWTEDSDPGIRYFSGIATYRKTISVPSALRGKNMRLFLDLGRVEVIARVRLNGKDLGVCWTAPFRLDITGAVRAGANELEIEVANMWSNRLTGDAQPGAKKYAKTNIAWKPDTPLLASGLLGPVRLVSAAEQEIRLA